MAALKQTPDPTDGFIQYVQSIKPYHTKIAEVEIEYITPDTTAVVMVENWTYTIV